MVNRWELDLIFTALSDPTRRHMLHRLSGGVLTVSDLAQPYAMSLPAVLKHIKVLESAGLVTRHKDGRTVHVRLHKATLREASAWIETQVKPPE